MSASSRQMAKLPNVCVIGKYPDPNLGLPFRNGHASAGARLNQGSTMKITYLLAALLLVSSFATQATTVRTNKSGNRAHVALARQLAGDCRDTGSKAARS